MISSSRLNALTSILLAFVFAGCSGIQVTEVKAILGKAKPCCAGYSDVAYSRLTSGTRQKFEITSASPALQTSEGLAYFAAFRVPQGTSRLEVQALNTEYLPKSTYPDPLIVALDAQHQRIGELKNLPLARGRHRIIPGLYEYYFAAEVPLPAHTEYVLVFARPNSDRTQATVSDNGTRWPVPAAPVGTLALVAR